MASTLSRRRTAELSSHSSLNDDISTCSTSASTVRISNVSESCRSQLLIMAENRQQCEECVRELLRRIDCSPGLFLYQFSAPSDDRERQIILMEGLIRADGGNNDAVREIFSQAYDAVRQDVVSSLLAELTGDPPPPVGEARMHAGDDSLDDSLSSLSSTQSPPTKRRRLDQSETGNQDQEEGSSGSLPLYMDTINDTGEPQEQEQAEDPPAPHAGDENDIGSLEYSTSAAHMVEDGEEKGEE